MPKTNAKPTTDADTQPTDNTEKTTPKEPWQAVVDELSRQDAEWALGEINAILAAHPPDQLQGLTIDVFRRRESVGRTANDPAYHGSCETTIPAAEFDERRIADRWGGGLYELRFRRSQPGKRPTYIALPGGYPLLRIAGEPRLPPDRQAAPPQDTPAPAAPAAPANTPENPTPAPNRTLHEIAAALAPLAPVAIEYLRSNREAKAEQERAIAREREESRREQQEWQREMWKFAMQGKQEKDPLAHIETLLKIQERLGGGGERSMVDLGMQAFDLVGNLARTDHPTPDQPNNRALPDRRKPEPNPMPQAPSMPPPDLPPLPDSLHSHAFALAPAIGPLLNLKTLAVGPKAASEIAYQFLASQGPETARLAHHLGKARWDAVWPVLQHAAHHADQLPAARAAESWLTAVHAGLQSLTTRQEQEPNRAEDS